MSITSQVYPIENTFRLPAKCSKLVVLSCASQIPGLLSAADAYPEPPLILGYASNIILPDFYAGMVILNRIMGVEVIAESGESVDVEVGSGEIWHDFVVCALQKGWYGVENLGLIPGAVGAALVQNIGAYGVELSDVMLRCQVYCCHTNALLWLSEKDCSFGYRRSIFKCEQRQRYVITRVVFRLSRRFKAVLDYPRLAHCLKNVDANQITARRVFEEVCSIRRSRLPDIDQIGTVGSFFVNPVVSAECFFDLKTSTGLALHHFLMEGGAYKLFVGDLLTRLGWRGYRRGGFTVSAINPIVLMHSGSGCNADLVSLINDIRQSVWRVFSIRLMVEPEFILMPDVNR